MARSTTKGKQFVNRKLSDFQGVLGAVFRGQSAEFKALWLIIIFLALFGSLMVYSSSYVDSIKNNASPFGEMRSQLFGMLGGALALVWTANMRPEIARKLGPLLAAGAMVAQLLVLFTPLGKSVNGNRNWLNFGIATVQPSEFLKIALIMMVASFLVGKSNFDRSEPQFWVPPIATFGVIFLFVGILSKDMGTMIVMAVVLIGMFFVGGLPNQFLKWVLVAGLGGILLLFSLGGSRRGRIMAMI